MSIQRPGEEADRRAQLAADFDELTDAEVLAEAQGLVAHYDEHPRAPRGQVLRLWGLVAGSDQPLAEATLALAKKGVAAFKRDFSRALEKAKPAGRKRLLEALEEATNSLWDDDVPQRALRAICVELSAGSPAEALVLTLTAAVESSDDKAIAAAVKAIAAAKDTIQVPTPMLSKLVDAIGQLGEPKGLAVIGEVVGKLGLKATLLERVLAQTIGGAQMTKATKTEVALLALVPKKVTWDILAYNLACNAAIHSDKPRMLEMAKLALALGKEKPQFMAESDFDAFKKDREFLALFER